MARGPWIRACNTLEDKLGVRRANIVLSLIKDIQQPTHTRLSAAKAECYFTSFVSQYIPKKYFVL
jgi:hypothetical protein